MTRKATNMEDINLTTSIIIFHVDGLDENIEIVIMHKENKTELNVVFKKPTL